MFIHAGTVSLQVPFACTLEKLVIELIFIGRNTFEASRNIRVLKHALMVVHVVGGELTECACGVGERFSISRWRVVKKRYCANAMYNNIFPSCKACRRLLLCTSQVLVVLLLLVRKVA